MTGFFYQKSLIVITVLQVANKENQTVRHSYKETRKKSKLVNNLQVFFALFQNSKNWHIAFILVLYY